MNEEVRVLFYEMADLLPGERARIFRERQVSPDVREEVESLLRFDSADGHHLTAHVSDAAQGVLQSTNGEDGNFGPYRLKRLLGVGGMGEVYLAERTDGEIQQQVAIKQLRRGGERPGWHSRFLKERQLLASLNHPAIARLIDVGHTADGRPYLVMEYVDGVPIDVAAAGKNLRDQLALFLRVCEGVSHAHHCLVIHRDLKPSNVLVDSYGQPKLLDFGIAKLVDETGDQTQPGEGMFTLHYASPEQLRGERQTTATDVYSLGAVLYKLLAGRSPHESEDGTAPLAMAGKTILAPSRFNPNVPADLDHVVRQALRLEPGERYASVEAFAADIRAFLDFRPVQACSGDAWYRARKSLRRHWVPVVACLVTITGLSIGLWTANRQGALAQRRFHQVRQLANKVIALGDELGRLPGATKARHGIVAMTKEYLEALAPEAREDRALTMEIALAYLALARAQGDPASQNLGQFVEAEESLRKAQALLEPLLVVDSRNRQALFALSDIAGHRMSLARRMGRPNDEVLAHAHQAASHMDAFLGMGTLSQAERYAAVMLFYNIAATQRNLHLHQEALSNARRSTELARPLPPGEKDLTLAPGLLADLMRISGDFQGALEAVRETRTRLERVESPTGKPALHAKFAVLWREGVILGGGGGLNLNRPDEATVVLRQAFDLLEELARKDPDDASCRILFDQAARELGAILRDRDPREALAVYDHAIRRLGEVKSNGRARRGEAGLLAGSTYALRRLDRAGEAKDRLDVAFRLLRDTKDYPADRIDTDSEAEPALRALADHHAATGKPQRAAEVYEELLDKILASKPDPANDLRHAVKLSRIYGALAVIHSRNSRPDRSQALAGVRLELWRQWARKLPGNAFVQRELKAANN